MKLSINASYFCTKKDNLVFSYEIIVMLLLIVCYGRDDGQITVVMVDKSFINHHISITYHIS